MQPRRDRWGRVSLVCIGVLLAWIGQAIGAQAPASGRNVWDGAYTEAQAERGRVVFDRSCANCHTLAPDGRGPLVGEAFWDGFTQRTVGELLTYVSTSMPNGAAAGSLPASSYNDVVALILRANGLPAGTTELAPGTAAGVQIVPEHGAGDLPNGALVRVVGCLDSKHGGDWVLTRATAPERIARSAPGPEDAVRPLGDRTIALKFVLTRLDDFVGRRVSASGLLIGRGGHDGLNVTAVTPVADSCP